jgi:flavin reductase (DIM6/NTAB) family NADH-FMN oxidoreductase RutF
MSLDPDAFRAILGRFATGVTVVTTTDASGNDHGMTVSAFASLSLDPPLILICIERVASMHDLICEADYFAVNILCTAQEAIARRFAETGAQRFTGVGYKKGQQGVPVLNDVLAYMECRRVANHDGGDHTIIVGETETAVVRDARPLLYYRGGFAQLER